MIQKENKDFSINASNNAKVLAGIAESMGPYLRSQNIGLERFGEGAIMNVGPKQMKNLVKNLADKRLYNKIKTFL